MSKDGDTFRVTSHNQQGGLTAGQVFIGGGQRTLSQNDANALLQNLPKSIPVVVSAALGDGEAHTFALEIKEFLSTNGYAVEGVHQCVWSAPIVGVSVIVGENPRKIQVGTKPQV